MLNFKQMQGLIKHLLLIAIALSLYQCGTYKESYVIQGDEKGIFEALPTVGKIETLFLLGDAGHVNENFLVQEKLYKNMRLDIEKCGAESSLVFLGDNIYPSGLPKKHEPDRETAETLLNMQLDIVKGLQNETYFIPGNHDWNKGHAGGLKAIQRQEKYVQNYFEDQKVRMYPNNGCGDPVVKKVEKDLYYVFLDSQWWIQNWHKEKNINDGCHVKSRQEFLQELESIFLKHKNDQVVVFVHHPFYSLGEHGGKFDPKYHLFPLTYVAPNLWIPLPILGSIMPLHRATVGHKQDIPHANYQLLKNSILELLSQNKNVIFASGHEHSLQYFDQGNSHFVISGAGSKSVYARNGPQARFVRSTLGYSTLHFYKNGAVWLDFTGQDKGEIRLLYRKEIVAPKQGTTPISLDYPEGKELPLFKTVAANKEFAAKGFKQLMLGKQYRDMWTTPVEAPVINFETEKGGLVPIKKGGGMASNSLRVETSDGRQYALRSVIKDYRKLVGPELRNLKLIDLLADTNSASHPYGALIIPTLSKAANIYYTIPKLVYLKHQKGLGYYNELFNEELYLLEDRPAGDRSDADHLGNSEEIISYLDLIARLKENPKLKVDEEWTLRSRIFDLFIHDWDRHDDQWRWAKVDVDGKEVYRPIPRDRDQAFYKFEGLALRFASAIAVRKFKTFKDDLKDVKWQSFNARYFDRYFLHQLEWEDWEKEIAYLKENLTDEVIEQAALQLPPEVYENNHKELIYNLKSRRDNLERIAKKLYRYISKKVSIPGSDDDERFEIERLSNGDLFVQVFRLKKNGKKGKKIYERKFIHGETKEVRLYGLAGKDEFEIDGEARKSIKVRVIGGFGKDKIDDDSKVSSLRKRTILYDEKKGIKQKGHKEIRDLTGPALSENDYDRKDHVYDRQTILPILGFTQDDRFWFGAQGTYIQHGFRKVPYRDRQDFAFSFSPTSRNALQFTYQGDFRQWFFNTVDFQPSVFIRRPFYENYFGLGNQSIKTNDDLDFNWVRMQVYEAHANLKKSLVNNRYQIFLGPRFKSWGIDEVPGRFISLPESGLTTADFDRRNYLGYSFGFKTESLDEPVFPHNGVVTDVGFDQLYDLASSDEIRTFRASQTFILTIGTHIGCTFASRTGFNRTIGDLQFYHFPSLGNGNFLRGFRNERFRGNTIFYQNFDLRVKLANSRNQILPFDMGLLGGFDLGRVWLSDEEETSGNFHRSYTAGVWFNVLNLILLNPHVSFSEEETQINFRLGFNF